ncbi:MAG: hypothetical protein EA377_09335 [Phycisphaerales bacterium]|nr:MAG: hypothetical protein EA377_09335 [Phycisphaerales bacterium]
MQRGIVAVLFVQSCGVAAGSGDHDLVELLAVVNDHTIPCEDRAEAERELIESSHDVSMLPILFSNLADPIFSTLAQAEVPIEAAYASIPGTGSAETDCLYLPTEAQVAYARFRIWKAFSRNGKPEDVRMQVYADLFEEANSRVQFVHFIGESRRNWTPKVREHIMSIYQDPEQSAHARLAGAHTLLDMRRATPDLEQRQIRERMIAIAWGERGSEFPLRMGKRLGFEDPRVAALKLDGYDHEVERAGQSTPSAVHLIDTYFGNVSRLYIDRRSAEWSRRWVEYRDERIALQEEARETGDDTKLREFEAEVAAQQQAELELRIERIDAWIDENRDRLEQEAEEYHRERMRERSRPRDSGVSAESGGCLSRFKENNWPA